MSREAWGPESSAAGRPLGSRLTLGPRLREEGVSNAEMPAPAGFAKGPQEPALSRGPGKRLFRKKESRRHYLLYSSQTAQEKSWSHTQPLQQRPSRGLDPCHCRLPSDIHRLPRGSAENREPALSSSLEITRLSPWPSSRSVRQWGLHGSLAIHPNRQKLGAPPPHHRGATTGA